MTKRMMSFAITISLIVIGGLLYTQTGASQTARKNVFSPDVQDVAEHLLSSPGAQFLSSSGFTALELISGKMSDVGELIARRAGSAVEVLSLIASPTNVMVNNPAMDTLMNLDISSQSETAVAGHNGGHGHDQVVVVTFNDSAEFAISNSLMGYSRSTNGGVSFTDLGRVPESPTGANMGDPALVSNRAGQFYVAAIAVENTRPVGFRNTISIQKSTNAGLTWGPPVYVPPAGVLPNSFQDKEFIAVDNGGGPRDGSVYVSWTSFPPPGVPFSTPILFSRSTDGGASFSTPIPISPAGSINQGSEPAVSPNGDVYVTWEGFLPISGIFVARSTNGGVSFGPPVLVSRIVPIGFGAGSLFGNFRVNSFPRIDVNPVNGDVYIVYAANPRDPPSPGVDTSDVYFTRSTNAGATWSAPLKVNDDATTNDQFFPDVAVNSLGHILVTWYDKRNDPDNLKMDVFSAQSTAGVTFLPNERVTTVSFFPAVGYDPILNRTYMGDYLDVKSDTGLNGRLPDFLTAWSDFRRVIITNGGRRPDQDVFFARR